MSVSRKSSIEDIISPCAVPETNRHQAFVEAQNSNYSSNGEIRFVLPANEILDMSEAYLDMLLSVNTTDAAVASVYTFANGGTAGSFRFTYNGKPSPILQWNTTGLQIQAALRATETIGGCGFLPVVTGPGPWTITVPSGGYGIFDTYGVLEFQEVVLMPDLVALPLTLVTSGSRAYPRVEFLSPIIQQIRIDINNTEVCNITGANYLTTIFELIESVPSQFSQYYLNGSSTHGYRLNDGQQWRVKFKLDVLDLFKKILPLDLLNLQVRLYMKLEQDNLALIQGPTGGGTYSVSTPKLHYHKIDLSDYEKTSIATAVADGGLIIPFKNTSNWQQNITLGTVNNNFIFNPAVKNMLGVLFLMSPNAYTNIAQNNQKFAVWLRNALGQYRLKVGSGYYPLDQIDSLGPSNEDMTQPITELESMLDKIETRVENGYDRQIYFNYAGFGPGNNPYERQFIPQNHSTVGVRFLAGISTTNAPVNAFGVSCHYNTGIPGVDTSSLSNVSLELKNMNLAEDCTLQLFTFHQDYLIIRAGGNVTWIK